MPLQDPTDYGGDGPLEDTPKSFIKLNKMTRNNRPMLSPFDKDSYHPDHQDKVSDLNEDDDLESSDEEDDEFDGGAMMWDDDEQYVPPQQL